LLIQLNKLEHKQATRAAKQATRAAKQAGTQKSKIIYKDTSHILYEEHTSIAFVFLFAT
jgi:hypothetical protein